MGEKERYIWIDRETTFDSDKLYDKMTGIKYDPVYATDLLNQQDKLIKELEKQLKNAIIPRFKIDQKCYMIPTKYNGLKEIKDYTLLSISLSDIGIRYDLSVNKKESGVEPLYCASEDMFGISIFATKEEAQAKLKELQGVNYESNK